MEKKAFFEDNAPPPVTSIRCFLPRQFEKRTVFCDKEIVEVILDDLLFAADSGDGDDDADNGNGDGGMMLSNVSNIFELVEEESLNNETTGRELYKAVIRNVYQYDHVIQMVACGLSFRQTSNVLERCKSLSNDTKFGCISVKKVSKLVRIYCALALQIIKRALNFAWCFSIALDGGNKAGTPYLEVRLRFVLNCTLFNVHLLAIPMFESHTGLNMFNVVKKAMDALCPEWEKKIIGYTSDGASNMTGSVQGLGTRIGAVAGDGFYRVWCAAHQLDLVIQDVLNSMYKEEFVNTAQLLTGHLRRQKNLIREMKSTCPRFISTRWLSMGRLLNWLKSNRRRVQAHLDDRQPACTPKKGWWIAVFVLQNVMVLCNKYMIELQGKQLLLSQQKQILERLRQRLMHLGNVQSSMSSILNSDDVQQIGSFSMSHQSAKAFVLNLGDLYAVESYQELEREDPVEFEEMNKSVARIFVRLVHGIFTLSPERDSSNRSSTDMPPCQPRFCIYEYCA